MRIRFIAKIFLLPPISGLLFLLSGFNFPFLDSTVPIKKILDNPRDYEGKTVTISGEVTDVFSLFVAKSFAVRDKTGEIIVVTERILPKKGGNDKSQGKDY